MRPESISMYFAWVGAVSLALTTSATAGRSDVTIHVDAGAPANGDGSSWRRSFRFLQDALVFAADPERGVTEIRVGRGVYRPDRTSLTPEGSGDRTSTFGLIPGIALRGGYAGRDALTGRVTSNPDERDPQRHPTVLSGDLIGDDEPGFVNNGENAYHVVTAPADAGASTVLDGCTVTSGNADDPDAQNDRGGGLFGAPSSDPTIVGCTFVENSADGRGGGMHLRSSTATILRSSFAGNRAASGGGLFVDRGMPTITHCTLMGNTADFGGGLSIFDGARPAIANCILTGNTALRDGAGMHLIINARPTIASTTIVANTAVEHGGGLAGTSNAGAQVINCILWANEDADGRDETAQIHTGTGTPVVRYSCVQGGWSGAGGDGITDGEPAFVDPIGPDGDAGTGDEDLRLGPGSACIDAGHNWGAPVDRHDLDADDDEAECVPRDLHDNPRFADVETETDDGCGVPVVIDMGALEAAGAWVNPIRPGDVDGSGRTDFADLIEILRSWGECETCCLTDVNLDGFIDAEDVVFLLSSWTP